MWNCQYPKKTMLTVTVIGAILLMCNILCNNCFAGVASRQSPNIFRPAEKGLQIFAASFSTGPGGMWDTKINSDDDPFIIKNFSWNRLLQNAEEPNCSHLKEQHEILFNNMKLIQENILQKDSVTPIDEYEHELDQLITQSSEFVSLEHVGFKNFFQIYFKITDEAILRDIENSELILVQNSTQIEPFELDRFINIPWELKSLGKEWSVKAKVSALDICQMKTLKIFLMSECQIQDNSAFECAKKKNCPQMRVSDWRTCKVQKNLIISLESLAKELGRRSGSMRRR